MRITVFGESDTERLLRGNRERICRDAIDRLFEQTSNKPMDKDKLDSLNVEDMLGNTSYLKQSVPGTGAHTQYMVEM